MQNVTIKCHKNGNTYSGNHFFILSKGLNSGKPLKQACPNSFVVVCDQNQHLERLYCIAYSLWHARYWHRYLLGTAIPFLRIADFKTEFERKMNTAHVDNSITALQQIEHQEATFLKNLALLADMRNAILYRYIYKQ